jgi:polar amino acid transport system substrate-binding protein
MKRILIALATLLALAAPGAHAQDTLAQIKQKGEMVVGNGGAYPPFDMVIDGQLAGFDIDMGNEIARRMGVKIKWEKIDFSGIIAALTSKRVDLLITGMTKTPERAQRIGFSVPYYETGIAAALKPGVKIDSPKDLAGKVVAVQVGTSGERYVRDNFGSVVKELKVFNEFPLAFADVEAGRADAVVNTLPVVRYNAARRGNKLAVAGPWTSTDVGINARLEDTALMAEINRHLQALKKDGFLAKLDQKWFK